MTAGLRAKFLFIVKYFMFSRQAFNKYPKTKDAPWKYWKLADAMLDICSEYECNDTYGRIRMYQALQLKQPEGVYIPGERTVYRVMEEIGLNHKPKRKPNGIIKASDGKLYVSAIFDCYDLAVLGLSMDTNMKTILCEQRGRKNFCVYGK